MKLALILFLPRGWLWRCRRWRRGGIGRESGLISYSFPLVSIGTNLIWQIGVVCGRKVSRGDLAMGTRASGPIHPDRRTAEGVCPHMGRRDPDISRRDAHMSWGDPQFLLAFSPSVRQ